MPGPHRRFLAHLASVANIRPFVERHRANTALALAYDAAIAMLRALRDKHMQMVSRYIVVKSHEQGVHSRSLSPTSAPRSPPGTKGQRHQHFGGPGAASTNGLAGYSKASSSISGRLSPNAVSAKELSGSSPLSIDEKLNLATATTSKTHRTPGTGDDKRPTHTGTGGTALIPFLKQARDETAEGAVGDWFRRTLTSRPGWLSASTAGGTSSSLDGGSGRSSVGGSRWSSGGGASGWSTVGGNSKATSYARSEAGGSHVGAAGDGGEGQGGGVQVVGLNGVWRMDDCEGGICHW